MTIWLKMTACEVAGPGDSNVWPVSGGVWDSSRVRHNGGSLTCMRTVFLIPSSTWAAVHEFHCSSPLRPSYQDDREASGWADALYLSLPAGRLSFASARQALSDGAFHLIDQYCLVMVNLCITPLCAQALR
jgi:hypothetical protein